MRIKRILPIEVNLFLRNITKMLMQTKVKTVSGSTSNRVFFLDAASYNNLGDQAISYAMGLFLKETYGEENYIEISEGQVLTCLSSLRSNIKENDVIALVGGGNMGDLYPRYEAIRRKIIRNFPNNKIIIFPQTIDYTSDNYGKKELERSIKIYNKHKFLTVCAREEKSYTIMKKLYSRTMLIPDIVFYLYGLIKVDDSIKRKGIGICLRNDKESCLSIKEKEGLVAFVRSGGYSTCALTTMTDQYVSNWNSETRLRCIKKKIQEFNNYQVIITDRLHGMIFSIIAGVPCIAIDNSNKKVSGVFHVVEKNVSNVKILSKNNINLVQSLIDELANKKAILSEKNTFYKSLVEELMNEGGR